MQHEEIRLTSPDGTRLFAQTWGIEAPRGHLAIAHGLTEHGGRYAHLADRLNREGFDAHALDHRGHGRSGGERCNVSSFEDYLGDLDLFLQTVRERAAKRPVFLFGHSLGGLIATLFVIRRQPQLAGLILSGPGLELGPSIPPGSMGAAKLLGWAVPRLPVSPVDHRYASRDPGIVAEYARDPLVYRGWLRAGYAAAVVEALREVSARRTEVRVPLLAMHGTDDKLASPEGSRKLVEQASSVDKTLKLYPGLYHEVLNEPEKERVIADLLFWLNGRI